MIAADRIKNKVRRTLYQRLLYKFGFGSRVSKGTWEAQFKNGFWDYLNSKDEIAHYLKIVEHCRRVSPDGKILEVGCGKGVLYHY